MSVLESARKAYAKIKAQRNGHAEAPLCERRDYDIDDRNDESPPYRLIADPAGLPMVAAALGTGSAPQEMTGQQLQVHVNAARSQADLDAIAVMNHEQWSGWKKPGDFGFAPDVPY